ncbi:MAG: hypothetical protein PHW12_04670 [Smithella sp.]|nr:hypothetical protein [Smithella sp.]MDD5672648.1 hypothetical protein [Chitinivibrionales bacterium]
MKLSMKWIYRPNKVVVIGFIVVSVMACYAMQTLIKREFLSKISESIGYDKHNQAYYKGLLVSVANDNTGEINAFVLNPFVNWQPPLILFAVLICIGGGLIFIKSKLMLLVQDKTESGRKIKELEGDIERKKSDIYDLRTKMQNETTLADNLRTERNKFRESYDAISSQNAALKKQYDAALQMKDREHEAETGKMQQFFARELFNAKNPPNGPAQTDDNSI